MKTIGKDLKFVLIGGGSFGWTHRLVTDIGCIPSLHGMHIVLHDIDAQALRVTLPLCQKVSGLKQAGLKLEATTNLKAALRGADFVGLTISVGGQRAHELDHLIPERYGVLQTVGDTVGPGGWSRALRYIPVVVDIMRTVESVAPNAWFMNYSNPMTILTRALQKVSPVKTIGLCHELQGLLLHLAYYFGVDWQKDIRVKMAGINHLIWMLELSVRDRDGFELLRQYLKAPAKFRPLGPAVVPRELVEGGGVNPNQRLKFDMFLRTGYLPGAGDVHTAEFFRHYLSNASTARRWGLATHRRAHTFSHVSGYAQRRRHALDLLAGKAPLPLQHSHEHASKIIAALSGAGDDLLTPVNTGNVGQIDNLPRAAVVETLASVNRTGVTPLAVGRVPPFIEAHLMRHIPNQEMIVDGALRGDRELVTHALSCDPLIPSPEIARRISADIFKELRHCLPQFHGKWRP